MADKVPNPAIPNSVFRLRIACEECHIRKIKCCSSIQNGSGACEACRFNDRKCLFSLKGKLGRPRKLTRTISDKPDPVGGLLLETSQSKAAPVRSSTSRAYTRPSILETLHDQQNSKRSSADSPDCDLDSSRDDSTSRSLKSPIGAQPSLLESQSRECYLQEWDQDAYRSPRRGNILENGDMSEVRQTQDSMQCIDSYDDSLSVYANEFIDFSKNEFSQTPPPQAEMPPLLEDWSDIQLQAQQLDETEVQTLKNDDLEILQTYREVHKQMAMFSRQKRSLLAESDQDFLRQMINTMEKLSGEITSFSKNLSSMEGRNSGQQSLAIVLLASVIQVVENVSQFREFAVQSDVFRYQPQSQRRSHPSPPESIISMDDWGALSGMRLELIMVVSRLDFFLMQFKVFISQFNSLLTVISLFHPAQLIANLQSLHQQIGIVLENLRSEWA